MPYFYTIAEIMGNLKTKKHYNRQGRILSLESASDAKRSKEIPIDKLDKYLGKIYTE